MFRSLIRHWRSFFTGRGATLNRASAVAARAPAYPPSAWFDQGWQLLAANQRGEVEALLASAEFEARDPAELACLSAGLLLLCGDPRAAQTLAETALAARADFSRAYVQRAHALRAQGQCRAALDAYRRATELTPDDGDTWAEQAAEHLALDERDDALDCYHLALAHAPDCVAARLGISRLLRETGDTAAALGHIRHAMRIAPHDAALHFESALVHTRCGDTQGAIAAYERVLALRPADVAANSNLGLMYLSHLGDPQRAKRYFERAIEFDPSSIAAQANLGLALEEQGRVDAALAHYEKLIAAYPAASEYRWNRGLALLGSGDYARGWEDYELRNARAGAAPRAFPYPVWQGGALPPGTALLVYAEQGLGDEIMFASCVPDLLARGINCVIECDARLSGLFARAFSAARVHGAVRDGDRSWLATYPEIKEQIAIGSLPRLLRRTATDFPSHTGYLHADPLLVAQWRARFPGDAAGFNVGISWRGGTAKTRRDLRTIPLRDLAPLLKTPGVTFINLQRNAGLAEIETAAACGISMLSVADALDNVDETAALLQALDCVITVDNTLAHLAGALGCRTMIMLACAADWRWRSAGGTSPWYPSAQLYRQQRPGECTETVAAVAQALKVMWTGDDEK